MTVAEALSALAPLIGAGGVSSFLVAYLGYKAQKGKAVTEAAESAGLGPVKASDVELAANSMTQVASAVMRLALVQEYRLDMVGKADEFEAWVDAREMRATLKAFKAEQARAEQKRRAQA